MWRSVFRDDLLAGKVAIVTGGGSGIGKAIAREISLLGGIVVIASRDESKLLGAALELNRERVLVHVCKCDIRREEDVVHLMAYTVKKFGRIDFLVNNGGGQYPAAAETITAKGWKAVIDTNLTGTFWCCQQAFHYYMKDHGGVIVNMIVNYFNGFPNMVHTGAARAGVDTITKTLAIEWAEFGIRVNSVAPGIIYSDTAEANYSNKAKHELNVFENHLASSCSRIPARRLGSVEEVSSIVVFLLSEAANYVTGATYRVDGGHSVVSSYFDIQPTVRPPTEAFPVYGKTLPAFVIASPETVGKFDNSPYPENDRMKQLMLRGKL